MGEAPTVPDGTLVYLCNLEWCDDGYHEEEPVEFQAFLFRGDIDEFNGESLYCFPLDQGEIVTAYRMPCQTWYARTKPERMTVEEARRRLAAY